MHDALVVVRAHGGQRVVQRRQCVVVAGERAAVVLGRGVLRVQRAGLVVEAAAEEDSPGVPQRVAAGEHHEVLQGQVVGLEVVLYHRQVHERRPATTVDSCCNEHETRIRSNSQNTLGTSILLLLYYYIILIKKIV
jgi:hypothetical protein